MPNRETALQLRTELADWISSVAGPVGAPALKPGPRQPFHWPPRAVAYQFRVPADAWTGRSSFEANGETFEVEVAETPRGVFGRCPRLWHDARGDSLPQMLKALKNAANPLFERQLAIARTLGLKARFEDVVRDLPPLSQLKLLFCPDRDVAAEALTAIETHSAEGLFGPSLVLILQDRSHPQRRSAQWCVLDMFEDLEDLCPNPEDREAALRAMRDLLWDAEDDFARTVFKAGVVLGGHLSPTVGGPVLLECLNAPSRIGRRSAIHGLFHTVEWDRTQLEPVRAALLAAAGRDSEPLLREFALGIANDLGHEGDVHVGEPTFADEA